MNTLPDCLAPPAHGVHNWLYGRALFFYRRGATPAETEMRIRQALVGGALRPGREVTAKEIADTLTSVWRTPYGGDLAPLKERQGKQAKQPVNLEYRAETGWPAAMSVPATKIDMGEMGKILGASDFAEVDFWERTPIKFPSHIRSPGLALRCLFHPDHILCLGRSSSDFGAKMLKDWAEDEIMSASFVVPNPLRAMTGTTKNGTTSAHCRDATGPRRYIILESDAGLTIDEQARLIEHVVIATKARLACVTNSGGKSLHGWIFVNGYTETQVSQLMNYAARIGFDPRLYLPEQFVRLPDGLRDGAKPQPLMFLANFSHE